MMLKDRIKKDHDLAGETTFKIGGPARYFIEVRESGELEEAERWAEKEGMDVFFLGGGSNILISDDGFKGLVIKLANRDLVIDKDRVFCGAGANMARVIQETSNQGLSGLEWAAGIPGMTVGGAIRGNAGAFGVSISDLISSIQVYDISDKKWSRLNPKECRFDYRESIFKDRKELVIWDAELKMRPEEVSIIKDNIKKNVQKRSSSQPRHPSAGSIFKNITWKYLREQAPSLADRARYEGVVKGGKVGAGWIIDRLDLKGKSIGGAQVSEQHANFIINSGDATALDVITLVGYIKQKVRQEFNLRLREEIQYVGF